MAKATTSKVGFYEMPLPPGTYLMAVDASQGDQVFTRGTTTYEVTAKETRVRLDWWAGVGGGTWLQR